MNRDALRATAHNGCVQPVRGSYGAIHVASHRRPRAALCPRSIAVILLVVGLGAAAYFLIAGALSPQPRLRILSPAADAVILGGKTTVSVEVRGGELGAAVRDKSYHLHYYLDADVPNAHDRPAIPATGAWASTMRTTYDWDISGAGIHILAVQLVTSDDRPLSPPVVAAVVVQVPKTPLAPASVRGSAATSPGAAAGGS